MSPVQSQSRPSTPFDAAASSQSFAKANSSRVQATEALHSLTALAALFASFAPASAFLSSNCRFHPPPNINFARSQVANVYMGPRKRSSKSTSSPSPVNAAKKKYQPARVTTDSSMSVKRQIHLIRRFERARQAETGAAPTRTKWRKRQTTTITKNRSTNVEEEIDIDAIDLDARTILLVDGYNVIGKSPDISPYFMAGDITTAANILVQQLSDYAANSFNLTIAFDARGAPHMKDKEERSPDDSCRIVWAHSSADGFLIRETARLREAGTNARVMVVTDDIALADACARNGAWPASADLLLLEMEYSLEAQERRLKKFNVQQIQESNDRSTGLIGDLFDPEMKAWYEEELSQESLRRDSVRHWRPSPKQPLDAQRQAKDREKPFRTMAPLNVTELTKEEKQQVKKAKKKQKKKAPVSSLWHSLGSAWQDMVLSKEVKANASDSNPGAQDEETTPQPKVKSPSPSLERMAQRDLLQRLGPSIQEVESSTNSEDAKVEAQETARIKAAKESRLKAEKARLEAEDEASIKAAAEALTSQFTANNIEEGPEISRHYEDIWDVEEQETLQPVASPAQEVPGGHDVLDFEEQEALQPVPSPPQEKPRPEPSVSPATSVSEVLMPKVSEVPSPIDYSVPLAALSKKSSADKAHRSALAAVRAAIKAQQAVLDIQKGDSSTQPAAFDSQLSALDAQRAALEAQRASLNAERALRKNQRAELSNVQSRRGDQGPKNRWQRFKPAEKRASAEKEKSSLPDLGVISTGK